MEIKTVTFKENHSSLTCYLQHSSPELPMMAVRPAVLIFPGGAYQVCSDREAEPVALAYMAKGYNAFVLRYTTTGHDHSFPCEQVFDAAYQEACASLAYLQEHAEELHIDVKKIVVCGFSAGANLAAALGTMNAVKPAALILGYPSVDNDINDSLGVKEPNMIEQISKDTPPAFLFTTQGDTVVPSSNTLLFALGLSRYKIPYEVHVFATGDHGLSLAETCTGHLEADVRQWFNLNIAFLDHIFSGQNLLWAGYSEEKLSINSRIDMLLSDRRAKSILTKYLPQFIGKLEGSTQANGISLRRMADFSHGAISEDVLHRIDEELHQI